MHIMKVNNKYVLTIETDTFMFEKIFSPIEFLKPNELDKTVEKAQLKQGNRGSL